MKIFRIPGIGSKKIIDAGCKTEGKVTAVKECWWIQINTKPVRRFSGDGSVYPQMVYFQYRVEGIEYNGKKMIHWDSRRPSIGEKITVWYDPKKPKRYAVKIA